MLHTIESRYFRVGKSKVINRYAERFASLMADLESLGVGLDQRRDYAAALLEATITEKFEIESDIDAFVGVNDNLIVLQGEGDAMKRISIDTKSTDGAFERLSKATVALAHAQMQCEQNALLHLRVG